MFGALSETRTRTARATAPSRQRVYQFHHQSICRFTMPIYYKAKRRGLLSLPIELPDRPSQDLPEYQALPARAYQLRHQAVRHLAR